MKVKTPGRICLFGEHQDYLGLPVIAMAISLRMSIKGTFRSDNMIKVDMPDLNEIKVFCLDELNYKNKDYFKSGLKICKKAGMNFSRGMNCQIKSIFFLKNLIKLPAYIILSKSDTLEFFE